MTTPEITLRLVKQEDLDIFFLNNKDPESVQMAAFTAKDPADRKAFDAHWARIMTADTVIIRTIEYQGEVAGSVLKYEMESDAEISYWIGREYWGKGIATEALRQFIEEFDIRPLHAHAAADNLASICVLKKCGFVQTGTDRYFANARGEEIEEVVMRLY
jgi:RimJ/RimL family protein N-acetyltransferase